MFNSLKIKKLLVLSMMIATLLVIVQPTAAGGIETAQNNDGPDSSSYGTGLTDRVEVEAFLDDLLGRQMEEHHIAGAAVSVVKDGKLFFAKGYGYADLENGIPVDPEQTIFRVGSVTKLFTATAVMQLVEQGRLDLDADINNYLDFSIPETYPEPITLKHLLTHTSGFEQWHTDMLVTDTADLMPAREWLVSHPHARVRPPGEVAAYSNYNTDLAGYIVSQVSGLPYDQYIQEHILDPLGMTHSTVRAPVPPDLSAHVSVGYTYENDAFQVDPGYMAQLAETPAAGLQASATDIARFMIAHLQDGRYSDADIAEISILNKATVGQMHSTLYTPDPRILGTAHGFFDFSDNGQRTIGHGGEAPPMNSLLLLLPDQNLGVFVVYNSEGGGNLTSQHLEFQRAFFDHYYPRPAVQPIQPAADFANRAGRFEGSYRITSGSHTTFEKLVGLFSEVEISASGDGTLLHTASWGEWRFVEVEPLYFRQTDGQFDLVFREDDQGQITYMFAGFTPMFAYEKLNWYETSGFNMRLLLVCALVFLTMIPVASIRAIRNRRLSGNPNPAARGTRIANRIIVWISILNLLFLVGNVLWGSLVPLFGVSMPYKIVLGLGVLSAALTVGALVYTVLAWKNRYWGIVARVYYTLVTVAAVAFVWFLNYWNLLGWRF